MSDDTIIDEDRLLEIAGLKQRAALRRHLKRAHIPFQEINGRIFSTQWALDSRLVGHGKKKKGPNWNALDAVS